jgi:hypothetical protein
VQEWPLLADFVAKVADERRELPPGVEPDLGSRSAPLEAMAVEAGALAPSARPAHGDVLRLVGRFGPTDHASIQVRPKDLPAAVWQAEREKDRLQRLRRLPAVTTGGTRS